MAHPHMNSNVPYEPFKDDVQVAMVPTASGGEHMPVVQQPTHVTTFVTDAPSYTHWNWCNLITAICSICCCQILGLIATVVAVLSYVDHKVKDFSRSRHKRNVAWCLSITAIVLGSGIIIIMIIVVATLLHQSEKSVNTFMNNVNRNLDMHEVGGENY